MLRFSVDFNTMMIDPDERVLINDTPWNKKGLSILVNDQHVILYDDEMEVEAVVEFDSEYHIWLGKPEWRTRKDI